MGSKYAAAYKRETIQMIEQEGMSPTEVSSRIGVYVKTLYRWLSEYRADGKDAFPGKGYLKLDYITEQEASFDIAPKGNNTDPWECDFWQYKERHWVECFLNKLKQFRREATRYDKLISRFKTFVYLACAMILLK